RRGKSLRTIRTRCTHRHQSKLLAEVYARVALSPPRFTSLHCSFPSPSPILTTWRRVGKHGGQRRKTICVLASCLLASHLAGKYRAVRSRLSAHTAARGTRHASLDTAGSTCGSMRGGHHRGCYRQRAPGPARSTGGGYSP